MRVPTSQRMRHRTFALTEEQDLALAELSRRTGRDASSIVRAAVVRALAEHADRLRVLDIAGQQLRRRRP